MNVILGFSSLWRLVNPLGLSLLNASIATKSILPFIFYPQTIHLTVSCIVAVRLSPTTLDVVQTLWGTEPPALATTHLKRSSYIAKGPLISKSDVTDDED